MSSRETVCSFPDTDGNQYTLRAFDGSGHIHLDDGVMTAQGAGLEVILDAVPGTVMVWTENGDMSTCIDVPRGVAKLVATRARQAGIRVGT